MGEKRLALQEETFNETLQVLSEFVGSLAGVELPEGELRVLFLGPFALNDTVDQMSRDWSRRLTEGLGCTVNLLVGVPTYSEMDLECMGVLVSASRAQA